MKLHLCQNAACSGDAWQACVRAVACLPGAGTTLWCPACPASFAGRWSGPATKATALLRHAVTRGGPGGESGHAVHATRHRRLLAGLVELLLADPPEGELMVWASTAQLLQIAGPLLAEPTTAARRRIAGLLRELLGSDSGKGEGCETDSEGEPHAAPGGSAGHGDSPVAGQSDVPRAFRLYNLYTAEIPLDVVMCCEDATKRTLEGVPLVDLVNSSDEDGPQADGRAAAPLGLAPTARGHAAGATGAKGLKPLGPLEPLEPLEPLDPLEPLEPRRSGLLL